MVSALPLYAAAWPSASVYAQKPSRKNEAAENYQAKVYYDPAYRLDSPVQTIINNINPDVGSLPDCQGYGQIRYPDKNISRQLLGPDGHASQAVKFCLSVSTAIYCPIQAAKDGLFRMEKVWEIE